MTLLPADAQMLPTAAASLLADSPLLDSIGRALRSGPSGSGIMLLLLGAVVLVGVIVLAMRWSNRRSAETLDHSADMLGQSLTRLGLSRTEQADLRFIALNASVREPAAVLLSPHGLAAATHWALKDGDPGRRKRMATLCHKLFGEELPPTGSN